METVEQWFKRRGLDSITDVMDRLEALEADVVRLRGALRKLQYSSTESCCDDYDHDEDYDGEEHNLACVGCGNYKCQGCKPDCWLAALLATDAPKASCPDCVRLRGALKEIIENSHIGIRDVNTFHQAINYLRSINGIASAALLATDALK